MLLFGIIFSLTIAANGRELVGPAHDPRLVQRINSNPDASWKAELSPRFEGWSLQKVASLCGGWLHAEPNYTDQRITSVFAPEKAGPPPSLPINFDGRSYFSSCNVTIGHVRDQTDCGACWAFAATESFNDRLCIARNGSFTTLLSVQDTGACCSGSTCQYSNGCVGGQLPGAWGWFVATGVVTGGDYDDVGKKDTCLPFELPECTHNVTVHNATGRPLCPQGEYKMPVCAEKCNNTAYPIPYPKDKIKAKQMIHIQPYPYSLLQQELMTFGPVSTIITVYTDFISYKSGVYKHLEGQQVGSHAVEIVGWGVEGGDNYWLVKNSWGNTWGMEGFVKIGYGQVGIENSLTAGYVE